MEQCLDVCGVGNFVIIKSMKQLIWKLVWPLTIISFGTITMYWYVLPTDAPDSMFSGFPFPYVCEGWHTSMSLQYFFIEMVVDLFVYFLCWYLVVFFLHKYLYRVQLSKIMMILLWTFSLAIITMEGIVAGNPDNIFHVRRSFDMVILETGFQFAGQTERPDRHKYPSRASELNSQKQ